MGFFEDLFCGPRCLARMAGMACALGASLNAMQRKIKRAAAASMPDALAFNA